MNEQTVTFAVVVVALVVIAVLVALFVLPMLAGIHLAIPAGTILR